MDHRITAQGVETDGTLTARSDITSIALVREPAVVQNESMIAQGYWLIVFELVAGDFIEIPQNSPSLNQVLDGLPKHFKLWVADLDDAIAAAEPGETLLWEPGPQR